MLKDLEEITRLSENYVQTSNDYSARLKQLKDKINERFKTLNTLAQDGYFGTPLIHVAATDDGQLRIEANNIRVVNGQPTFDGVTISYEDLLAIAAVLQEDVS